MKKNDHWQDRVQKVYSSLEELEGFDRVYAIVKRLKYRSAKKLWNDNPIISGSTDPNDLKVIKTVWLYSILD